MSAATNGVPHTRRALTAFWRRHQVALAPVPRELYDALDALIRLDERRVVIEELGMVGVAQKLDDLVAENATLTRQMASRHVLGGCPHCARASRIEPLPRVPLALIGLIFASALLQALALALNAGALVWD